MKKFMFFVVLFVMSAVAVNAQEIISIGAGQIRLANGVVIDGTKIENPHLLRVGEDINAGLARIAQQTAMRRRQEAMNAAYTDMYAAMSGAYYGGGYYGGAYYGGAVAPVAPVYGGGSSSFSIGNDHWGFSTSSSNYGGYKSSSTGVRIGSFHIGTSNSGYSQPTMATPSYTRSSASYEAQKKSDAKAAAKRYSAMKKNNDAGRNAASSSKYVTEANVDSFLNNNF